MHRLLYSIPECERELGIGKTMVYRLVAKGRLDLVKIGNRSLITGKSMQALAGVRSTEK